MSAWILYLLLTTTLLAIAARIAEEVASLVKRPTRWAWVVAIGLSFLTPLIAALVPNAPAPIVEQAESTSSIAQPGSNVWASFDVPEEAPLLASLRNASLPPTAERLLLMSCAISSCVMLVVFAASYARLRRARTRWQVRSVCDVPVLLSRRAGPAVLGMLRPMIVLPEWVLSSTQDVQRMVVLHESEHLRARDHRLLAIGCLGVALAPWNPALWWMFLRLRAAVEVDCDRRVLLRGADARAYGSMLLGVARRASLLPFAVALRHPQSLMERRIRAMTRVLPRFRSGRVMVLTAAASLCLIAAIGVDQPEPIAPTQVGAAVVADAQAFDAPVKQPPANSAPVPVSTPVGFDKRVALRDVVEQEDEPVEIAGLRADHPRQQVLILPHDVAQELREKGSVLVQAVNQRVRLGPGILLGSSSGDPTVVNISGKVANAKVVRSERGAMIVVDGVVVQAEKIEPGQQPSPLIIVNNEIIGTTEAYLAGRVTLAEIESASIIRGGPDFERFGRGIFWIKKREDAPESTELKLVSPRITVRPPADPTDNRQPLYVVDGVVISRPANIQGVSSADIESIEVIKGIQAIELYGEAGRDGVIRITTRQNKRSEPAAGTSNTATSPPALEALKELTLRATGTAAPLIVVDGVVVSRTNELDLETLKRLEIESIEVIKGAAAERLYGARAAAGVITIVTKRR